MSLDALPPDLAEVFEIDPTQVYELTFEDPFGDDLGTFAVDPTRKVMDVVRSLAEDAGLPTRNTDQSPRRYEAFAGGKKLSDESSFGSSVKPGTAVRVYPAITTGSVS